MAQLEVCTVGALGLLEMIAARAAFTFLLSTYISWAFLKVIWE